MNKPKISLILTTYNSKNNFLQTLESIVTQDYENYEIVVKDGGSTDGTLEEITAAKEKLGDKFLYISTPDTGIYDAMNQGFQLSTGELIAFFNDKFAYPQVLSEVSDTFTSAGAQCIGVHSDLHYVQGERIVRNWHMGKGHFRSGWMPGHPTLYLTRRVYESAIKKRNGLLYDTSLKISADYEFMIRSIYGQENHLAYLPKVTVKMFYGGTSSASLSSYVLSLKEGHYGLKLNKIPLAFQIDIFRTFRVILQLFLGKINKQM